MTKIDIPMIFIAIHLIQSIEFLCQVREEEEEEERISLANAENCEFAFRPWKFPIE